MTQETPEKRPEMFTEAEVKQIATWAYLQGKDVESPNDTQIMTGERLVEQYLNREFDA